MGLHQHRSEAQERERLISSVSDRTAWSANCEAIDRLTHESRYPYIVAWGKFLGFAPETVHECLQKAEADNAPPEAIQKIDGEWLLLSSIQNDGNRRRVVALARPQQDAE